ncbi:hypothetical protein [Selenihalanaerobacter shriftii]|uniref:Uncharacterized protein n=1 Tax=Selenihalanaerobacter shriftii TaxID=142842 RepID=A0A1T4LPS1_9FIRM|nr:hypothetical protein [Selenihalanaerobacter shriftii]SJZ56637.1 hypothetical protein SAMN02745118_01199 [Selenihalanaerobacter shriftii]
MTDINETVKADNSNQMINATAEIEEVSSEFTAASQKLLSMAQELQWEVNQFKN